MSKIKVLTYIVFLFLLSCKNSSEKQNHFKNANIIIDLDNSSDGKLSEFFSGISYTLIDSEESNPLVESYKTVVTKNSIFIQDFFNSYVHQFDRDGNPRNIIKSTGEGPKEYQQLDHFQVVNDTLYILDRSLRKILTYNSEMQVVNEKPIPVNASIFHKHDNRMLFFMNNENDNSNHNFLLFQEDDLIEKSIEIRPGFEKFKHGSKNGLSPDFNSGYIFPIPFSQDVAFFHKDLSFHKKVTFDFGRYSVKESDFIRLHNSGRSDYYDFIKENNLVENISIFTKLGNYYFMSIYQTNKKLHFIFLDKNMEIISQVNNFDNDIDLMKIRNVPWTVFEKNLTFKINSIDFYNDYLAKFSGQNVTIETGSIHEFFQKNQEKLKDDQTVLVSLTLKDSL